MEGTNGVTPGIGFKVLNDYLGDYQSSEWCLGGLLDRRSMHGGEHEW